MIKNNNIKKKKKIKINTNKLILILVMLLISTVGIGVFFKSNIFEMEKIIISGNKELHEKDILSNLKITEGKNIFSYDTKIIKEQLLKNPYIEDVKIKLKLPNKMIISIDEIIPVALLKDDQAYCYISSDGSKIEEIKEIEENNDKIIVDIGYKNKDSDIEFENDEVEKRLLYLLRCIFDDNINKEIKEINFREKDVINLVTKNNIKVIIPNNDNLDYNVSRLSKVLIDLKSKNQKNGIVDLTYSNYALYSPNKDK